MTASPTSLDGVILVTPQLFSDSRGFLLEAFNKRKFEGLGLPADFVQDNHSRSRKNVLRGLHYQIARPQGKFVSVARGAIFDVAVDIRRGSPNFGKWIGVVLDDEKRQGLWIPPGFAHGFCALSEDVDVIYKCTDYYDPASEGGIRWNDPMLGIKWPIDNPILSKRDESYPLLADRIDELPSY